MVGLVLISHSQQLATALVDLIAATVSSDLPIIAAGGVGPNQENIGTDATQILEAINRVFSSDGVLVLVDMGSAVLSAETAREFLEPDQQSNVQLCSAPLVEGAISAAVQLRLGSNLRDVTDAAKASLLPKQEQIGDTIAFEQAETPQTFAGDVASWEVEVENEHGLHLRPAASLLKALASLSASVQVTNVTGNRGPVPASSLTGLARLQISQGDRLRFQVAGRDRIEALRTIQQLAAQKFGEVRSLAKSVSEQKVHGSQPFGVSAGVGMGRPVFLEETLPILPDQPLADQKAIDDAVTLLRKAVGQTAQELAERAERLGRQIDENARTMLEAQELLVQDTEVRNAVEERIRTRREPAARAWQTVLSQLAEEQASSSSSYLQARAADFRAIQHAVLRKLAPGTPSEISIDADLAGRILVCDELTPSILDAAHESDLEGVIQLHGGPTSHGAILARALRLPAVGGAAALSRELRTAKLVGLDGNTGQLWIDPDDATQLLLRERREAEVRSYRHLISTIRGPAVTQDGTTVLVGANAGSEAEVRQAREVLADGIGLFRTEFLYRNFDHLPSEEEQFSLLDRALEPAGTLPINVRLLDIGADKPLPFLTQPVEANPYLGVRGIRLLLRHEPFLQSHLRSILRLGADRDIRILAPMVTELSEVLALQEQMEVCHRALCDQAVRHLWPVPLGIMIETPAAALLLDQFAAHISFASLGTNDLTQYVLSSERGHSGLTRFADALHPAVLKVCARVIRVALEAKLPLSLCGEIAGDLEALPVLIAIGLTHFSVRPAVVSSVKARLRELSRSVDPQLADPTTFSDAAAVRGALAKQASQSPSLSSA
jgi:multiphosphoryl transfer protein